MPWPRRSEKERGNCGAAGDGGRVNNHSADDADKASTVPTRTLNASLSPVSRSLTSIQAKQPSQNSVSDRIHGMLKPRGPGYCDHCSADRAANLITCVPYCLLAARNVARAQTRERKIYAGSLCAVATFSTAYHALEASHKEAWARKADYWAIACAATAMGRMLFPKGDCPGFYDRDGAGEEGDAGGPCPALASPPPALFPPRRGRTRVSLSLTPFQPFAVITAHSVAMEAEFARRARKERRKEEASGGAFSSSSRHHHHHHHHSHRDQGEKNSRPSLSAAHRLHVYSGAAAVAAFFAEDLWPRLPFVHSTWHVLSALAMAATEPLVDDAERRLVRGKAKAASAARAAARSARAGAGAEVEARKRGGGGV